MIQIAIVFDTSPDGQVRIDETVEHHTSDAGTIALAIEKANARALARAKAVLNADA